jgi:hypothetical protein
MAKPIPLPYFPYLRSGHRARGEEVSGTALFVIGAGHDEDQRSVRDGQHEWAGDETATGSPGGFEINTLACGQGCLA